MEIKDKKGSENSVVDHLTHLHVSSTETLVIHFLMSIDEVF